METVVRTCAKCGGDVTHAKRFKDSHGRFYCEGCAAKAKSAARGGAPTPATTPPSSASGDSTVVLYDGTIALSDGPAPAPKATSVHHPPTRRNDIRDMQICPDCATPLGSGPICASCGYDRATGLSIGERGEGTPPPAGTDPQAPKPAKPKRPCSNCGYELTGLKSARCPECGKLNARLSTRPDPKQTLRWMYLSPLIMIAAGLAASSLITFLAHESVPMHLLAYAISVPIGFVTYFTCSVMFIGFDEPMGVTFVRLAGVFAVVGAVSALLGLTPLTGIFGLIVVAVVFVGLLMNVMELDIEDAWLVIVAMFLVQIALGIALAFILK